MTEVWRDVEGGGPCPNCKRMLDAATGLDSIAPEPDDLTICLYCRTILIFDEQRSPRRLTEQEKADMHPENRAMLVAMQQVLSKTFDH